ncbi:ATP phosphoribosyltransferase [Haloimpatiens sp. FM7330]|uniref:ATP phosphoribosyltransferase n=1 Tax=Haloimpatiens sp. FM7330 TaxID=3298610 RepID=UPI00362BED9C
MITIALAKGRLAHESIKIFKNIEIGDYICIDSRKLIFEDKKNGIRFLYVKPSDVVIYVQKGVADLGIVGKDVILESDSDVYEVCDLGFGKCKFSVAGKSDQVINKKDKVLKVATKYPKVATKYFEEKNQPIEIIKLNGSVELAPLVGLSDVIVDIVETGNTLKVNGLAVLEDISAISARLIANRVSYRFKLEEISYIVKSLENCLDQLVIVNSFFKKIYF